MMSAPTPLGTSGRDPAQFQLARDAVLPALCQAFGAALARFDDALFDRAGNAGASQLLFLDAMRELRRRREEIAAAFAGHLQRAWAALVAGEPLSADATLSGPAEDGLSLLAEHVLESRLAVRNFATVLLRDFKPVLARLDRRLGWLAGDVPLDADLNPISPEHLGVAIHEAFAGCELAPEVHLVLIKLCERDLRAPVGRIYDKLDEQLAAAGVMSQMGAVRRTPAAPGPRSPQGLDDLVDSARCRGSTAISAMTSRPHRRGRSASPRAGPSAEATFSRPVGTVPAPPAARPMASRGCCWKRCRNCCSRRATCVRTQHRPRRWPWASSAR